MLWLKKLRTQGGVLSAGGPPFFLDGEWARLKPAWLRRFPRLPGRRRLPG
jgi:hypothetical protein